MSHDQSGHERLVEENPNPLKNCFCGVTREDCPGGRGWVSPNEIEGVPGNYANYLSVACAQRLARGEGDALGVASGGGQLEGGDQAGPEPHVNPTADTLEAAWRALDEKRAEDDDVAI